jgi:hypothetical protein
MPGNYRTLKLISNDDFFIKQALLLHVNAFAAPGVARLRPYSMAFDFGINSEIFTLIFSIPSHLELRLVYTHLAANVCDINVFFLVILYNDCTHLNGLILWPKEKPKKMHRRVS